MNWRTDKQEAQRDSFYKSIHGLATWLSLALTLIAAPALYEVTRNHLEAMALRYYGNDYVDFIKALYWMGTYPIVFFAIRASLVTAIMTAAMTAAVRLI